MFELKPITHESIPRALLKAERYRLLNEPSLAESICRDVLAIDAGNREAIICLILSLTDMFTGNGARVDDARHAVPSLADDFDRLYYEGVIEERWARAAMEAGDPPASIYHSFRFAMHCFENAQSLAPPGNDDAVLRWNACVRTMKQHHIGPTDQAEHAGSMSLDDDVPMR